MKMSEKTLLKKIEQAYKENYCDGSCKKHVKIYKNVKALQHLIGVVQI